ncbi:hypothetical protein [Halorussus salinisoli]|uniref:hypothetical protein n=1 Tax=Halorussus salinisoli TaxID=2558242 RepID=UPI0010C2072A|nr:hypothetical protein [Halorussus salinisoli]
MAESNSPASASDERRSNRNGVEIGSGQQVLLTEARKTATQQLTQINKLDGEAVRTVRITFVLFGVLVGGAKLLPSTGLGLLGAFGTVSLVVSLVTSLFVYGTSRLFIGSSPDKIPIDYEQETNAETAHVEIIGQYERGLRRNRRILWSNAFFLDVSRFLLACAVVLFVLAVTFHVVARPIRIHAPYQSLSLVPTQF